MLLCSLFADDISIRWRLHYSVTTDPEQVHENEFCRGHRVLQSWKQEFSSYSHPMSARMFSGDVTIESSEMGTEVTRLWGTSSGPLQHREFVMIIFWKFSIPFGQRVAGPPVITMVTKGTLPIWEGWMRIVYFQGEWKCATNHSPAYYRGETELIANCPTSRASVKSELMKVFTNDAFAVLQKISIPNTRKTFL